MLPLRELQQSFAEAVVAGAYAAATAALATDGAALRSLALYRRLIRNNYAQVLKITYPALHRLAGACYFGMFARRYFQHAPSISGDLFRYGRHLPAWLQRIEAPPLLVELARLEWACHEVYQAADSMPLQPDRFQALVLADPSCVTIEFQQTARFLSFSVPVHRVWQALQPDASPGEVVDFPLPEQQTGVVVTRREGRIHVTPLNWLDYQLLEALSQGASVASIERFAREAEAGFDITRLMTTLLNLQVIAGISVKEGV